MLWALNNLSSTNKHRSLIALGASVDDVNVTTLELPGPGPILKPYWDRANEVLIISRTIENVEPRYDLNVGFYIAFGDIEGLKGEPITQGIDYLYHIVNTILTGIESGAKRMLAEWG